MKNIILIPFCFESLVMYHKLKIKGYNVISFFDKNIYLQGKIYESMDGKCRIETMWRCYNSQVIICKKAVEDEIKKSLMLAGFDERELVSLNDCDIDVNEMSVLNRINVNSLYNIWGYSDGQKIIEIKKKIKLFPLVGKDYIHNFYGQNRKEFFKNKDDIHFIFYRLEIDLTSRCTLKCKKCCNMMAYFDNAKDLDVDEIKKDYSRMMEIIDWTDDIMLIGGEPLLYKNLGEIVEYIYNEKNTFHKVGVIRIVTNGTIVPNDTILKILDKCKVHVLISNYGDKSRNINNLIDKLVQYKINYAVQDTTFWVDAEQYVDGEKEVYNDKVIEKRINDCITMCRTVDSGKFYMCAHLKSLDLLHALPSDVRKCYVNIYEDDVKYKLVRYLKKDISLLKACAWCNGCSEDKWNNMKILAAEQTTNTLKYKKYE